MIEQMVSAKFLTDVYPTPDFPYYGALLQVTGVETETWIDRIEVNGVWVRDYAIDNDGQRSTKRTILPEAKFVSMYVRTDWSAGDACSVTIDFRLGKKGSVERVVVEEPLPDVPFDPLVPPPEFVENDDIATALPPKPEKHICRGEGGYWNKAWKYYGTVIVENDTAVARECEPVHQYFSVYSDRIADPVKEIRVVHVDKAGLHTEIPSQVYEVSRWEGFTEEQLRHMQESREELDMKCQPTCNFDVAFMSRVAAFDKEVYLVFYGNAEAEKPVYETDLKVSMVELPPKWQKSVEKGGIKVRHIENKYYSVNLNAFSGSLYDVTLKQGVNRMFAHGCETNGSADWNPDFYAPPVPWYHASDWQPEEYTTVVEEGPVFCMVKRSGPMPGEGNQDTKMCVTYIFYAGYKPIVIESSLELTRPRDVIALRNSEIVLNLNLVNEVAWKNISGKVETMKLEDMARHPIVAKFLPRNVPWISMFNRDMRAALGIVYMQDCTIRTAGGMARDDRFFYFNKGPWIYFARPMIYSFVSNNPNRIMRGHGDTISYEKVAWIPHKLESRCDACMFESMEDADAALRNPVVHWLYLDTDNRNATEWIPPILLQEFEERED